MNVVIDAWLERREPRIRIIEKDSGKVIEELLGPDLEAFLDRHGLDFRDLLCPEGCRQAGLGDCSAPDAGARPPGCPVEPKRASARNRDLRIPLNSIRGYAQLLARAPRGDLSPQQRGYLDQIIATANQMHELLGDGTGGRPPQLSERRSWIQS